MSRLAYAALACALVSAGHAVAADTEASLVSRVLATKSLPSDGRWVYAHGNKAAAVYMQLPVVRTQDRAAAITFKSTANPVSVDGTDISESLFVQVANCRAKTLQYLATAGFDEDGDMAISSEDHDPPEPAKSDLALGVLGTLCDAKLAVNEDYVMTLDDVREDAFLGFLSDAIDSMAPKSAPTAKP